MHCVHSYNIKPDLLILGKALTGGVTAMSAVLGKRKLMDIIVLHYQILIKNDQVNKKIDEKWMQEFELD